MIVKNETEVLKRCFDSIKPFIDYWVIVDTGSTDGTQELIKELLKEIPGELHECPWVDFGFNRTQAVKLARGKADYILFMDADDYLLYEENYLLPPLTEDSYYLQRGNAHVSYFTPQLVKGHLPWKWVGVLHEYLACDVSFSSAVLENIRYVQTVEGSRSKDPQKYWKHVELLEAGLKQEPSNERYVFYLAESYREVGEFSKAIEYYQKRVLLGGWEEEVFISLLQIAKLQKELKEEQEKVIESFYRAHRYRPHRAEPIYYLAELFNQVRRHDLAYSCIKSKGYIPLQQRDLLFNEDWINEWGLSFQLSIASYYLGHYQESLDVCDQLLENPSLPENFKHQLVQNRRFPLKN